MLIESDPKPVTSFSVKIANNQIAHANCTKHLGEFGMINCLGANT